MYLGNFIAYKKHIKALSEQWKLAVIAISGKQIHGCFNLGYTDSHTKRSPNFFSSLHDSLNITQWKQCLSNLIQRHNRQSDITISAKTLYETKTNKIYINAIDMPSTVIWEYFATILFIAYIQNQMLC